MMGALGDRTARRGIFFPPQEGHAPSPSIHSFVHFGYVLVVVFWLILLQRGSIGVVCVVTTWNLAFRYE